MAVQTQDAVARSPTPAAKPWAGRILACIDDDEAGPAIVEWLRALPGSRERVVVLLGLMPKPDEVRSRGIFLDKVRQHLRESGQQRLARTASRLVNAGVSHIERVELADDAQTVVTIAGEEDADVIVLVGKTLGSLQRRIVAVLPSRSLASRVVEIAQTPVVVLRQAAS